MSKDRIKRITQRRDVAVVGKHCVLIRGDLGGGEVFWERGRFAHLETREILAAVRTWKNHGVIDWAASARDLPHRDQLPPKRRDFTERRAGEMAAQAGDSHRPGTIRPRLKKVWLGRCGRIRFHGDVFPVSCAYQGRHAYPACHTRLTPGRCRPLVSDIHHSHRPIGPAHGPLRSAILNA